MASVDKPRETAIKTLYEVYEDKAYSNIALSSALSKNNLLSLVDKAFITEIVYGTLKYTITFDYIISCYSKIKLKKLSKWILIILRMSLYQIFFMDRVPDSAVCNESVKLSERYGHGGSKAFVNGILRNILRNTGGNIDSVDFPSISEKYGYNSWMTEMFINDFGDVFTEEMMESNMSVSYVSIRTNTLKISREDLLASLKSSGFDASLSKIAEDGIILNKAAAITGIEQFHEGLFYVQGESSMLTARTLDPKPGENILDLCSAPGGKTTHIAEIMKNTGRITAGDIFQHKLDKISETADRLGISIIQQVLEDASVFNIKYENRFDRVLADVPCSGTGIIRNRPEIKLNRSQKEIEQITEIQYIILENAGRYVKPGGTLVYSTCSVLKRENISQIDKFLELNKDYILETINEIYPQDNNNDGFFISKLKRRN